jgi:hypothetical protein
MDGRQDPQQQAPPKTTRSRVLTAIAIVVLILVISAVLDLLLQHQGQS